MGRSYRNYIEDNYKMGLLNTNWDAFWEAKDAETAWKVFIETIDSILSITCPIKHFKFANRKKPWISNALIDIFSEKSKKNKKY